MAEKNLILHLLHSEDVDQIYHIELPKATMGIALYTVTMPRKLDEAQVYVVAIGKPAQVVSKNF